MNAFDPEAAARRFLPPAEPTPLVSPYVRGDRIRYMSMKGTPYWTLATVLSSKPIETKKRIHWQIQVAKSIDGVRPKTISTQTHDVFKARIGRSED